MIFFHLEKGRCMLFVFSACVYDPVDGSAADVLNGLPHYDDARNSLDDV